MNTELEAKVKGYLNLRREADKLLNEIREHITLEDGRYVQDIISLSINEVEVAVTFYPNTFPTETCETIKVTLKDKENA